jgi:hypothetical protein
MDVVAGDLARAEKAADLLVHEVTGYRASKVNALEAQHIEEDSRAACCHRSGWAGIADLHPPRERRNHRGAASTDPRAREADEAMAAESDHRRDICRGVSRRRRCEGGGTRGPCSSSDPSQNARRWSSRHQDRPSRCTSAERGLVSRRSAVGSYPVAVVSRPQDDVREPRQPDRMPYEAHQQCTRLVAGAAWVRLTATDQRRTARNVSGLRP